MNEGGDQAADEVAHAEPRAEPGEGRTTDPREPPRASARDAKLIVAAVAIATTMAVAFAFGPARAGSPWMLVAIGAVYVPGAAATGLWLRRRGELRASLHPAAGDLTVGAVLAALMYGAAMGATLLLTPHGSPREAWILRIYLQLGDPEATGRVIVGGVVFVIAALEEIVWRGLVMRAIEGPLGSLRAWLLSSALYAAAHLPTLYLLGDPQAGPNPLIVAAALGCGLVWGRIVHRLGRLPPAVFAHAFFSWAIVSFPIWRP
jgi:membrane protease YdiL (CAAX protease family)